MHDFIVEEDVEAEIRKLRTGGIPNLYNLSPNEIRNHYYGISRIIWHRENPDSEDPVLNEIPTDITALRALQADIEWYCKRFGIILCEG